MKNQKNLNKILLPVTAFKYMTKNSLPFCFITSILKDFKRSIQHEKLYFLTLVTKLHVVYIFWYIHLFDLYFDVIKQL